MNVDDVADVDQLLTALVERLIELTALGRVEWVHVGRDDAFVHAVADVEIRVTTRDGDGRAPFILEIRNGDDLVIEKFVTSEAQGLVQEQLVPRVGFLFRAARRHAFRVGSVLDMLLAQLATRLDWHTTPTDEIVEPPLAGPPGR
jgi:hypothetical protein